MDLYKELSQGLQEAIDYEHEKLSAKEIKCIVTPVSDVSQTPKETK